MMRLAKKLGWVGILLGLAQTGQSFSLLGPFKGGPNSPNIADPWQTDGFGGRPGGLGYSLAGDIGGPMLPIEAYRWNVPVITYAFDESFLRYFGPEGVEAIEDAIRILNELPRASQMSATLSEYPLDTQGVNQLAASLGLLDIKSFTLSLLLEEMGLTHSSRFVWGLRGRTTTQVSTNYSVIQLNFDPVTLAPSPYVNGVLYNYQIFDALGPQGGEWASALEWYQLDPLFRPYSSVAAAAGGSSDFELGAEPGSLSVVSGLGFGGFYTGLTRDDVGGLRFLLNTNNTVVESLLTNVVGSSFGRGSPWSPFQGATNVGGTNIIGGTNLVRNAIRAGLDKITFQRVNFDSLLGQLFQPITNRYDDRYITNGRVVVQKVQRAILQPDIIFTVEDLGVVTFVPVLLARTTTDGWVNNDLINGISTLGGPGVISPPVVITFGDMAPYFLNSDPGTLIGPEPQIPTLWGSFDGGSEPPVVYPRYLDISLQYIRDVLLSRPN